MTLLQFLVLDLHKLVDQLPKQPQHRFFPVAPLHTFVAQGSRLGIDLKHHLALEPKLLQLAYWNSQKSICSKNAYLRGSWRRALLKPPNGLLTGRFHINSVSRISNSLTSSGG